MRACHVSVYASQDRRTTLEEALVELVTRQALRQFDPMVEATGAGVQREPHLPKSASVALPLPIIMLFDCRPLQLHAGRLEQLHGVHLRGVTYATHAEAGEILQRLDVLLARDNPADTDAGGLESLGARACDEDV